MFYLKNKQGCVFYPERTSKAAYSTPNEEILRGAQEGRVFYPERTSSRCVFYQWLPMNKQARRKFYAIRNTQYAIRNTIYAIRLLMV
ncbi:MAG: hypothetical protein ACPGWR_17860 [Ardenticatenaceae bacterium]